MKRSGFVMSGGLTLMAVAVLLASCVPAARRAPAVPQVVEFSAQPVTDEAALERGRAIFVGPLCTECHHVEPIEKMTLKEWREVVLPEMSEKAKLTPEEHADLDAYVTAAHAALKRIPK